MALPTVPERATVSRFSSAQIFRPQYDGHAPGQPHTVTGNADIPVRNHIRTADIACLPAVILTLPAVEPMVLAPDSALSRPRAGRALSYCCQWETNTAGTHQTGFLRFLKAPGVSVLVAARTSTWLPAASDTSGQPPHPNPLPSGYHRR